MGFYIDPPGYSSTAREKFLAEHGTIIEEEEVFSWPYGRCDELPVCLIDNGHFLAAGIAFDAGERDRFITGMQGRSHAWYKVSKIALKPFIPKSYL